MTCNEARRLMSPYMDSELGATRLFDVSQHLQQCEVCANRFDQERDVDRKIRGRLSDGVMPQAMWQDLADMVTSGNMPQKSPTHELKQIDALRIERVGITGRWGVAASLLLAAFVGAWSYYGDEPTKASLPEIPAHQATLGLDHPFSVRALMVASPDNRPFTLAVSAADEESPCAKLKRLMGVSIAPASAATEFMHNLELISVEERSDPYNRGFIEVRLNCCGEPVLVCLARPATPCKLPNFFKCCATEPAEAMCEMDGVKYATGRLDDVYVMVASRHPICEVVRNIRLVR